uniref:Uncharacterized protein n=1 Tax=Lepeophtheirus salmonis TaxID=72036 RepID=A0A0K2TLX9_LEPSM
MVVPWYIRHCHLDGGNQRLMALDTRFVLYSTQTIGIRTGLLGTIFPSNKVIVTVQRRSSSVNSIFFISGVVVIRMLKTSIKFVDTKKLNN